VLHLVVLRGDGGHATAAVMLMVSVMAAIAVIALAGRVAAGRFGG
jgi:hypothetical protein